MKVSHITAFKVNCMWPLMCGKKCISISAREGNLHKVMQNYLLRVVSANKRTNHGSWT